MMRFVNAVASNRWISVGDKRLYDLTGRLTRRYRFNTFTILRIISTDRRCNSEERDNWETYIYRVLSLIIFVSKDNNN